MDSGFIIKKLVLTGQDLEPAIVEFKSGLNIISGPTNTGKTFIFECLDYMLGGKKLDRIVTQAKDYKTIFMEIQSGANFYTLERAIKGGNFKKYDSKYANYYNSESVVLSAIHNKSNEDTISAFFLKLNNLWDKKIRTNAKGVIRTLSYRDISHLLLVSETDIIKTGSPLLTTNNIGKTVETNVVKYLITGNDDSEIIAATDEKIINAKKGKIELLEELITNINEINPKLKDNNISSQINEIDRKTQLIKEKYNDALEEYSVSDNERKVLSKKNILQEAKLISLQETISRSQLLKEYYNIDIKRLKSTIEAGLLLAKNENKLASCPYCSNEISDTLNSKDIEQTIDSCSNEILKINNLLEELEKSSKEIYREKDELLNEINSDKERLNFINELLNDKISDKLKSQLIQIENLTSEKNQLLKSKYQEESVNQFIQYKDKLDLALKSPKLEDSFDKLSTSLMSPICQIVSNILSECKYLENQMVTFSEANLDLVLDNEDRKLFGKGIRAITYATFILAIKEYTQTKDYTISVPIFDSPLVTDSKPKAEGEGISLDLAMDFYRYCAKKTTSKQIIILENEEPPSDILNNINHIVFTGVSGNGRKGFIPLKSLSNNRNKS